MTSSDGAGLAFRGQFAFDNCAGTKSATEEITIFDCLQIVVCNKSMEEREVKALLKEAALCGSAAVVVLKCGEGLYAFQRKTSGYPVKSQIGGLCLFGGNKEKDDNSARDTLIRELYEELPRAWVNELCKTLQPFSRFIIHASEKVMKPRATYSFICYVYTAILSLPANVREDAVSEGSLCLKTFEELSEEPFSWSYDVVFKSYLEECEKCNERTVAKLGRKIGTEEIIPRCRVNRIDPAANFGPYDEI